MPTPLKTTGNIRKHLTKHERESREQAEASLHSGGRVMIRAPEWLSAEARKVFNATRRRMKQQGILESADTDVLALYSDAVARYQKEAKGEKPPLSVTEMQAWSRLALSYAEKLGISATGRARLAKKKADNGPVDAMDALLGAVNDFTNGTGDDR